MNNFTLEELENLRLIYKTCCTTTYSKNKVQTRQLTDLEKSIINKLENKINEHVN